jgi:hydrogenase maturation protein HypF
VEIHVEGPDSNIEAFIRTLPAQKPPLALIDGVEMVAAPVEGFSSFAIRQSTEVQGAFQPVSADVALCADCERELFDPSDRRYLYPFINCTNCGPRFTIIKDLPYDRPQTTMAGFPMCPACGQEYRDPHDRRFHAQPVACPECGPHAWLANDAREPYAVDRTAILEARRLLREGRIVAVKGLGGFHLACDATDPGAVQELRRRKGRADKPFAVMAADLTTLQGFCLLGDAERTLLSGHEKPIVLLRRRYDLTLPDSLAPGLDSLGMMLPYTPLHHLLLNQHDPILMAEPVPPLLVMTSGNFSEEPIATHNEAALTGLAPLADAFLLHDRDIQTRCDDSVVRVDPAASPSSPKSVPLLGGRPGRGPASRTIYLRRSRGYAPYPVHLPFATRPTLAVGGQLKNAFCLTREKYAFLSQHIGEMENAETCDSFEQAVEHLTHLFRVRPEIIACDMHPGYFTTGWAGRSPSGILPVAVQHHHAHIAACMADNGLDDRRVIGLAFDGTGYGTDGAIWGGEALIASYADFERAAHLEYLPLPGGDAATRHPWRIAVGYASALGLDIDDLPFLRELDPKAIAIVRQQVRKQINAPLTSSMGRLFDAVACIAGVRTDVTYEAQAAMELEVLSRPYLSQAEPFPFALEQREDGAQIRLGELLAAVIDSARRGQPAGLIGARFHETVSAIALAACQHIRERAGLNEVALSGGVWQNQVLLHLASARLAGAGFEVYFHRQTPANDGGLALGQAAVANHILR